MTRGNQREQARAKNLKKRQDKEKQNKSGGSSGSIIAKNMKYVLCLTSQFLS